MVIWKVELSSDNNNSPYLLQTRFINLKKHPTHFSHDIQSTVFLFNTAIGSSLEYSPFQLPTSGTNGRGCVPSAKSPKGGGLSGHFSLRRFLSIISWIPSVGWSQLGYSGLLQSDFPLRSGTFQKVGSSKGCPGNGHDKHQAPYYIMRLVFAFNKTSWCCKPQMHHISLLLNQLTGRTPSPRTVLFKPFPSRPYGCWFHSNPAQEISLNLELSEAESCLPVWTSTTGWGWQRCPGP